MDSDRRLLSGALLLILCFMVAEAALGILSGSLVLLSDAAHMLTDAAAIGLALFASHLATKPAFGPYTYGLQRAEILSALLNGSSLLLLSAYFAVEGVWRLFDPVEVRAGYVAVTAGVGIVVNVAAAWLLGRANRENLNVQGAFQHVINDLVAFVATLGAGLVMLITGFARADSLAALIVALVMARAGYGLVRASGRVLLEAAPQGTDPQRILKAIHEVAGVTNVRDLHVWELTSRKAALSAHISVDSNRDCHERRRTVERLLGDEFGIAHTTLQLDHIIPMRSGSSWASWSGESDWQADCAAHR